MAFVAKEIPTAYVLDPRPRSRARCSLMPARGVLAAICIVLGCIGTVTALLPWGDHQDAFTTNAKRTSGPASGNSDVASDLYGIGVRIGFYVQALMNILCFFKIGSTNPPFIAVATSVALLICWTITDAERQISPCESWIVHNLFSIVGLTSLLLAIAIDGNEQPKGSKRSMTARMVVVFASVANLWAFGARLWFFIKLATQLPSLGTKDVAWLYGTWHLRSKLRFALLAVDYVTFACCVLPGTVLDKRYRTYRYFTLTPLFAWIIYVLAIEKTIHLNDLRPATQVAAPGQAFPLVLGIFSVVEQVVSWIGDRDQLKTKNSPTMMNIYQLLRLS